METRIIKFYKEERGESERVGVGEGNAAMDHLFSWLFCFFLLCVVLCLLGYQLICLADLETDYINPYDTAKRINAVVLPEFVSQGALCLLYLLTGQWVIFFVSLPYLCCNIRSYRRRGYLVDITEIYKDLPKEKARRLIKLYYLIFLMIFSIFWYALYCQCHIYLSL
ncbi:hypothetical protein SAY86_001327 [Trapa natans]|uniref:Uncharacterized protein n=1 Tax=Trapa natans TaxID=22666 RepID=A0AAN7MCF6_TRANT|nr:hypothetical protein SAY86_001327 [Trapa natans]